MALSFLLAAKQIGKYNRQLKQVVKFNKNNYKPSVNTKISNNLLHPHQTTNDLVQLHETAKKIIQPKEAASNFVNHETVNNLPRLPEFLARQEIYCVEIFVKKRRFHTAASERKYSTENGSQREIPRLPRIFYMQNPFTWIINKFDMKILEKAWDPTFCQTEFIRGTKQAVSTVMQLVTEGNNDDLRGLLTKAAQATLREDLLQPGVEGVRRMLAIQPSDIKVAAPRRVRFLKFEDRKFCDVDMMFVALKWVSPDGLDGLIYLELFASFRREYTQYSIPEWTIAYFKIIKINVLDR